MEKDSKPNYVKRKRKPFGKRYKCILCERLVMHPKEIQTRKNYSHGKKSKAQVTHIHRVDGGCLVELKRKKKER